MNKSVFRFIGERTLHPNVAFPSYITFAIVWNAQMKAG